MINLLQATPDKLRLARSSAATIDVMASWVDAAATGLTSPVAGNTLTAFNTAATGDIVPATAVSGGVRNVKTITMRNKDAALACDVTVIWTANATDYELHKATLQPGDALEYIEGIGFFVIFVNRNNYAFAQAVVTPAAGFAADTYLVGSAINVPSTLKAGTRYRLKFGVSKTAAGVAAPTINIRFGTGGAVGDTSRCLFTFAAQSGVADRGEFEVRAVFNSVGSGTSAVIEGTASLRHQLAVTGLGTVQPAGYAELNTVGGGFDSTVAASIIGASVNGGASAAWTITNVMATLENF